MYQAQPRSNDPLRRAIRKLVIGLEKREQRRRERRRHNRQIFEAKVHLCVQIDGNPFQPVCEAWAIDLSIGGIRCLTEQAIDIDDKIFVNFETLLGHPCYIPTCVRRCETLIGNLYQINGQFIYDNTFGPRQNTQAT